MKVFVKGGLEKNLTKNTFLASGGEGNIYVINNVAYKIYNDVKKMIPVSKIQELQNLTFPNIIKPEKIVLDTNNKPIGYTMKYVKDTHALCKLFTKSFKNRNSLNSKDIIELVKKFRISMQHVHNNKILVVDVNEFNFIIEKDFKDIYFIDVDSYQTQNFPATAIMESIKDRHSKSFNELTDWFSWGIITLQMFIGIHPYKGKHPSLKDLNSRMMSNVSIFNKNVSIPNVCEPLDSIPQVYRNWYKAIFEDGKRLVPPLDMQDVIIICTSPETTVVTGNGNIVIDQLKEFPSPIINLIWIDGTEIIVTENDLYLNSNRYSSVSGDSKFALTPRNNYVIAANLEDGKVKLTNVTLNKEISTNISGDFLMSYKGCVYVKESSVLNEIQFIEMPNNVQSAIRPVANVMESASHVFDGLIMQDMLGAWYASIFPERGLHYQINLKELKGYKIIDAKFDNNVIFVVGAKNGVYDKFIFRLSDKYDSYDIRKFEDVEYSGINFAVLDNGICVSIDEEEKLELSSNKIKATNIRIVEDDSISGDMKICSRGTVASFYKDKKLYKISLKKGQ